jgi:hypothetical protein
VDNEFKVAYKRYSEYTNERLIEIVNSEDYTDVARDAAQTVLDSDRTEYYQKLEEREQNLREKQKNNEIKQQAQAVNPLYDDVHQIAGI